MGALPNEQAYTMEDIYNLPEGRRAELIDGQLYMMAPPKWKHQNLLGHLLAAIFNHIEESHLSYVPGIAPAGVWLFADDTTLVEPDLWIVCDPSKIDEDGCKGAPDFIIEILSKSTLWQDKATKPILYRQAGVCEYWIVDPDKRQITTWLFQPESELEEWEYSFDDNVPVSICPGFSINLSAYGF